MGGGKVAQGKDLWLSENDLEKKKTAKKREIKRFLFICLFLVVIIFT